MYLCHLIRSLDVKPLELHHGRSRDDPHLTAIKENGLYDSLVESCSNKRRRILAPKDLTNPSPSSTSLPKLGTENLIIIVVLTHHPPKVLVNFDPLEHIPMNCELLTESQCQRYHHLPLSSMLHPDLALFQKPKVRVEGVHLHTTLFRTIKPALLRDFDEVHWVPIPKVLLHHPSIPQPPLTPWIRAR